MEQKTKSEGQGKVFRNEHVEMNDLGAVRDTKVESFLRPFLECEEGPFCEKEDCEQGIKHNKMRKSFW